jgi:CelD/BcsL family acetyltransferase involved in cellulose biosynthesis
MKQDQSVCDHPARSAHNEQFSWLEAVEAHLQDTPFIRDWLDLVNASQPGSVYLHPALVFGVTETNPPPLLCARFTDTAADGPLLASLAILAAKTRTVQLAPALPLRVAVHGHRVVGNEFLGLNSAAAVHALVRELCRFLASRSSGSAFILFEDVEVGTPLWTALEQARERREVLVYHAKPPQPHWWIDFPAKPALFFQQLSSKSRSTLKRKAKRTSHTIRCFTKPDDVPEFLGLACEISKNSWQSKRFGLRIRNDLREMKLLDLLARHGALRSYILYCEKRPAAFEFGLQWQGTYVGEETGYNQALAELSPGIVLLNRLLEDLIARDPPRHFDFGLGDAAYKRLVCNRQSLSGSVCLLPRGMRSELAIGVLRVRSTAARLFRNGLDRLGLWSRLRTLYRR